MIPSGYSRNVISGALPNGERWLTSFWCDEAPSDQSGTQAQAAGFAGVLNGRWASAGSPTQLLCSGATIDTITVYSYLDTSGKASYVGQAALTGSASALQSLPNQMAICATLLTGNAGRRNRGRMYWPALAGTVTNGELANTQVDNMATWMSGTITALNANIGSRHVAVLSQVSGTSHTVSSVRVDGRFDVQRRRANREVILHSSTSTVT